MSRNTCMEKIYGEIIDNGALNHLEAISRPDENMEYERVIDNY